MKDDLISRQQAVEALGEAPKYKQRIIKTYAEGRNDQWFDDVAKLTLLPSAHPEYEPVTAEDFAKVMSENTIWQFAAWYGRALALMKEQGFVICKKTM